MNGHRIATHEEWLTARRQLLAKEKEFTRRRDELSRERRALPWVQVEKEYRFAGERGSESLAGLFAGRSQLAVYHFMYAPQWEAGCKSCSFWADNFNGIVTHLAQRDLTLVAVSRAPLEKLRAQAKRLGWSFEWFSSEGSDFSYDYGVAFDPEAGGEAEYNYTRRKVEMTDLPGLSVFYKDGDGSLFHTYSCYARGLEMLNSAYSFLDLAPKGRDEDGLSYPMAWVRLRDQYER